jgi:hypothetical protein
MELGLCKGTFNRSVFLSKEEVSELLARHGRVLKETEKHTRGCEDDDNEMFLSQEAFHKQVKMKKRKIDVDDAMNFEEEPPTQEFKLKTKKEVRRRLNFDDVDDD